jgi:hypothetical protein
MSDCPIVVILGSAPSATHAAAWSKPDDLTLVAVNNAWRVRCDWDYHVHSGDFPANRRPETVAPGQEVVSYQSYVPAQNRYGGFVFAGGTMAFTAGYWALDALRPGVLAYFASDMTYSGSPTHFYGDGEPDPLRDDVTLRSLEAKSARLMALAARQGCTCINLSTEPDSRLVFPRAALDELGGSPPQPSIDPGLVDVALAEEAALGYMVEDGEYWHHMDTFDAEELARIDALWLAACDQVATSAPPE